MNEYSRSLHKVAIISFCLAFLLYSQVFLPTAFATININTITSVASASSSIKNRFISEDTGRLIDTVTKSVGGIGGSVLGAATKIVKSLTAQATEKVGSYIVDNAVLNLLKQYDKLSGTQKKTIKEYVCK